MEKGKFKVSSQGTAVHVHMTLEGIIDESATFPKHPDAKIIELHLDKLRYMTSTGIGLWIDWIPENESCKSWIFHKVRPSIVCHFGKVTGFTPAGTVIESFYAPFFSENTSESTEALLVRGTHFGGSKPIVLPTPKDSKGFDMVPDFLPDRYFEFLKLK